MAGLSLDFLSSDGRRKVTRGPYTRIRLEGEVMRGEAGGPVIAKHEDHQWRIDGEAYTRAESDSRLTLHFERPDGSRSKAYGPYEVLSFVDVIAYVNHEVFAFADRSIVDWYCHETGTHWPVMVVTVAP